MTSIKLRLELGTTKITRHHGYLRIKSVMDIWYLRVFIIHG